MTPSPFLVESILDNSSLKRSFECGSEIQEFFIKIQRRRCIRSVDACGVTHRTRASKALDCLEGKVDASKFLLDVTIFLILDRNKVPSEQVLQRLD